MVAFLLDANLSPRTAAYLRAELGLDAIHLGDLDLLDARDIDIVNVAQRLDRVVITFDLDYGELFHRLEDGRFGAIIMRDVPQQWRAVNETLRQFFSAAPDVERLRSSLVVIDRHRYRMTNTPIGPSTS